MQYASISHPNWRQIFMATLTIKNLPDNIYAALTQTAKRHRRSINGEAIIRLEQSLNIPRQDVEEQLERIRKLRESMGDINLTEDDLNFAKNEGRP
jgi:plasmid stability protein